VVSVTNSSVVPVSVALPIGLYAYARIDDNAYDENTSVLLFLSEALNLGITHGMKVLVKRPRPYRSLDHVQLSETSSVGGSYSFPSGHSSSSFTIATLLTLRYPDEPVIIAGSYLYATVTSLGRMYWGVHYPSDVLCGMLIGAGSAALIYSLRDEIIPAKDKLFNQSSKPDTRGKPAGIPEIFGALIAVDAINSMIFSSDIPVLKHSAFRYDPNGTYSVGFRAEF
jgi:undecaprenyl-diphosphatase